MRFSSLTRLRLFSPLLLSGLLSGLACGGAKSADPAISRFEVVPSTIEVGETATLKVAFSGGEGRVEPLERLVHSGTDVPLGTASSTEYTLTVTGNGKAQAAKASLTVNPGLLLKVEGLPPGLDAAVTVEGPDGFTRTLKGSEALKGLKPGRYAIIAAQVMEGSIRRPPLRLRQEVEISDTGAQVKVSYPAPTISFNLPGDVVLDFVLIPPGRFMMGAVHPEQTEGWDVYPGPTGSLPRHEVTFAKAFYLAKYPVTTRQWKAVTGWTTPDHASKDPDVAVWDRHWFDWQLEFLPALKKLVTNQSFRLPSEAEWEYALRAGSTTRYFWGDDFSQVDTYCWTADTTTAVGNQFPRVGQKQPNAWGLHDMFSVMQWTEDDSHFDYTGAPSDGSAWIESSRPIWRTLRGTSWGVPTTSVPGTRDYFQSAYRIFSADPSITRGLRLALDINE